MRRGSFNELVTLVISLVALAAPLRAQFASDDVSRNGINATTSFVKIDLPGVALSGVDTPESGLARQRVVEVANSP
jgi:hypothetical protein